MHCALGNKIRLQRATAAACVRGNKYVYTFTSNTLEKKSKKEKKNSKNSSKFTTPKPPWWRFTAARGIGIHSVLSPYFPIRPRVLGFMKTTRDDEIWFYDPIRPSEFGSVNVPAAVEFRECFILKMFCPPSP